MAKPDVFRILGCVAMVTLIFVIAVKLSKQCIKHPKVSASASASASASPSSKMDGACKAGFTADESGFCVQDY